MRWFIAAVFLVTVEAASLGSSRCTRGPAYWCKSLQTASSCNAFSHCMHTVWKPLRLDVHQTEVCKVSQKLVQTVRQVLSIYKAQHEEAAHLIASMCSFVQEDNMRKECKDLVTNFLPQIFKLMESGMEPATVATVMGLCQPYEKEMKEKTVMKPPAHSSVCTDCVSFVSELQPFMNKPGAQDQYLKDMEDLVCSELGAMSTACKAITEMYLPKLLKFFDKNYLPEEICHLASLCTKQDDEKPKWINIYDNFKLSLLETIKDMKLHSGSISCHECVKDLTDITAFGKDSHFRTTVDQSFAYVCSHMSLDKKKCFKLLDGFLPKELISMMAHDINPTLVCENILQCTDFENGLKKEDIMVNSVPETVEMTVVQENVKKTEIKTEKEGDSKKCQLCELVVFSVDEYLGENSTEAKIRQALDDVCNKLPSGIRPQCLSFVSEYSDTLVQLLIQELDPHKVCVFIKLCQSSEVKETKVKNQKEGDSVKCQLCELVVGSVDQYLGENRTEAAIRQALDDVCNKLPSGIRPQCLSFVNEYSETVVQLLIQELDPHRVCVSIKLCQSSAEKLKPEPTRVLTVKKLAGPLCSLCEVVVAELDKIIASNKSVAAVESALDKVCSRLTPPISNNCTSFVALYTPVLIDLLIQEVITPSQVCKALGLCSSTLMVPVAPPRSSFAVDGSTECDLCKLIITEINSFIGDNRTEAAVIHAVEKVCDLEQGDMRLKCQSEVQNYGPAVLDLLQHMDDPTQVCSYLRVCPSAPTVNSSRPKLQTLLGTKKCTLGPSFWCANLNNARLCGMEKECVQRYGIRMKP